MAHIVAVDDHPIVIKGSPFEPALRELGELTIYNSLANKPELLIERLRDADAAVVQHVSSRVTAEVLEQARRLKLIAVFGVGVDMVDVATCRRRGILVTNTPGANAAAVAEGAITLALAVARKVPLVDRLTRQGAWPQGEPITQLCGKTLGVVGTGNIGRRVAEIGKGLGMKVIAWTFHPSEGRARELGVSYVPLAELMQTADVVSINVRRSADTEKLISRKLIGLLKPTAILVNTSRGAVVDEEALVEALQQKRILGAGLDVYAVEPLPKGHPLAALDNVVLFPHNVAMTPETNLATLEMMTANIRSALAGKPVNIVA
ncbi:MAG: 3-phosphoglycerate dehydrogenase [Chloroflexi bacterium]|nr:3-phosphoglycerate dehydrogenase [Chloroflexota bacterium]